jgi:hypothetical protein
MNYLMGFPNKLSSVYRIIFNQFKLINELIVKTDDENLERLLQRPEDKVKFQKAIDEVISSSSTKNITINGKNITISI